MKTGAAIRRTMPVMFRSQSIAVVHIMMRYRSVMLCRTAMRLRMMLRRMRLPAIAVPVSMRPPFPQITPMMHPPPLRGSPVIAVPVITVTIAIANMYRDTGGGNIKRNSGVTHGGHAQQQAKRDSRNSSFYFHQGNLIVCSPFLYRRRLGVTISHGRFSAYFPAAYALLTLCSDNEIHTAAAG
jgi:hypothetical protein